MSTKFENNLIVALDIGTSKVITIAANVLPDGRLDIIGVGSYPSIGIQKGIVVNIETTVHSIQRSIEETELMAGRKIHSVFTGIAGNHIQSLNSHGVVAIKDKVVAHADIARVIEAAKAIVIPKEQKILHVLPQEFIIDHQEGIREPIGMSGVRLETKIHLITGSVGAAQNIINCLQRCDLYVEDIILEQLASSNAVLSEDEKQLGVCMIDIGGGTTDIVMYINGTIHHTDIIPIAGIQITNDIAIALRTTTQNAENIKIQYGCVLRELADSEETFGVYNTGNRTMQEVNQVHLATIVEPRYDELLSLIQSKLERIGIINILGAGIVITGGSSKMNGVIQLSEQIFNLPVRLGTPRNISGLTRVLKNPVFSTGIGLLLYGLHSYREFDNRLSTNHGDKSFFGRIKNWLTIKF